MEPRCDRGLRRRVLRIQTVRAIGNHSPSPARYRSTSEQIRPMARTFSTSKPCKRGHIARRYTSGGNCVECARTHRGKRSEAGRAKDRETTRMNTAARLGHAPPPKESDCPPRPLDGRCQCCGSTKREREGREPLCLDHDHLTGEFRGWICEPCNRGIGALGDDPASVRKAADYLERVYRSLS